MPDPLDQHPSELKAALTIRLVEQRLLKLFSEGKLFGTVHTCIGQEFVGVSVSRCLTDSDTLFSNHRGHGHFLSYRRNILGMLGEVMGKSVGVCGGRGGSQHLQQDGFYSNGIQGGIAPVTAGMAMAHKMQGSGGVAVVYIGDGTLGQGALYETLNIASKWDLPVLFVNENNLFAQSTSQTQTLAGDINARAEAFGIKTYHSNTWDWPRLFENMKSCIDEIRRTGKPAWHRVDTFRLMAHSKGDDNRPEDYVAPFREKDPINTLLREHGDTPRWKALIAEIEAEIEDAVKTADAAPWGLVEDAIARNVHREREYRWSRRAFEREKTVAAVRKGLEQGLTDHPNLVIIGEDIESPYGGAFKCTQGLSAKWPDRVRNTPISEHAIAGIGNGLAMRAMIPVVEIMFGDFMTLCMDQWVNHAAKFRFMFNDKVRVPVIIRTPMGGKRGYAATHSQSIEKHFVGLPDTQVLCLHHRYSPALLYKDLFRTVDRPTLVVENKTLYGQNVSAEAPPGFDLLFTDELFPTARLKPDTGTSQADVTIVSLGGSSLDAEEAAVRLFQEEEIIADVFFPTRLYPFDIGVLEQSLTETRRLLVVEEGQGFCGLGAEIIAQAAERFGSLGLSCKRLSATPNPIPAARPLEQQCLPGPTHVVAKAMEVVREFVH
ncbi:MAG TPA: thiamine pyrophosphate-dependent enzyme [Phycisphaerales bacterium]|nr:thiamine pyrophosphate-dependent enzyme [Phycisphaerales bacterium]